MYTLIILSYVLLAEFIDGCSGSWDQVGQANAVADQLGVFFVGEFLWS